MGSWNETCALTNLPIMDGDEVVFFLIEEALTSEKHVYVYSTDEWAPRGIHLYAKYVDYGKYEISQSLLASMTLESFQDQLHEMEQGENPYHDREVKLKDLSWELIQQAIYDNRLYVKKWANLEHVGIPSRNPKVSRVAVLREVFDRIIENPTDAFTSTYKTAYNVMSPEQSAEEYINAVKKFLTEYREKFVMVSDKPIAKKDKEIIELTALMSLDSHGRLELSNGNVLYGLAGTVGESYYVSWSTRRIMSEVHEMISKDTDPVAVKEILTELAKFNIFARFVDLTRHRWSPTCGAGSQAENYEEHMKLAEITKSICEKKIKEYEEF